VNDAVRGELLRTLRNTAGALFSSADPLCMGEALLAADLLPDALRETDALGPRLAALDAVRGKDDPRKTLRAAQAVLAIAPDNARAWAAVEDLAQGAVPADEAAAVRRRFAFRHAGLLEAPRDVRCHQLALLPDGGFAALDAGRPVIHRFDAAGRLLDETPFPLSAASGLALIDGRTLVLTSAAHRACLFLDKDLSPLHRLDFARFDGAFGQDWSPYRLWADSGTFYFLALGSRDGRFHVLTLPRPDTDRREALQRLDLPQCPFPLSLIPDGDRLWVLNFRPGLLCLYERPETGAAPRLVRVACSRPSLRSVVLDGDELFLADEECLMKRDARGRIYTAALAAMSPEGKATLVHMLLARHEGRRVLYCCDKTRRGIRRLEIDPPG
jgi:hypothetical protein